MLKTYHYKTENSHQEEKKEPHDSLSSRLQKIMNKKMKQVQLRIIKVVHIKINVSSTQKEEDITHIENQQLQSTSIKINHQLTAVELTANVLP